MTFRKGILFVLGTGLALTGCFGKSEPQPVAIGHVSTLSGPDRAPGEHAVRGIRLAVDEANKEPDKGAGRLVVVRHTDTRGELKAYESEAVRLVTINRVVALLGGTSPEEVEGLERAHVPVVTPDGLRTRAMGDAVFLTGLSPRFRGQILARFAAQHLAATTAAVIADERLEEGLHLAEAFVREFPAAVVKQQPKAAPAHPVLWRYGKDVKLDELAARIREAKPGVFLVAGSAGQLRDLLTTLHQPELPVLFGGAGGVPALQTNGGMSNPVSVVTAFVSDADTPRARTFIEQYKKAFSEEPDVHAALAYEGARLLFEALRQADSAISGAQIRDKLAGLKDFPGLTGPLSVGEDHLVRRPAFVVRLANGQARTVKRFEPEP